MSGIIGIIAFLTVLSLSLVITRVATAALVMTGLSEEAARFQARSAFTGTGFTTREAENVVNHPVRRRIIMYLMIVRSAGLVTIILSLILSFSGKAAETHNFLKIASLAAGVFVLWFLAKSKLVGRYLDYAIQWALDRWTDIEARDYAKLLRLSGDYRVTEMQVSEGQWLANKHLKECELHEEGITVLGIIRSNGDYVGVPRADTEIYPQDVLVLYGRRDNLAELGRRRSSEQGDMAHDRATDRQKQELRQQDEQEQRRKRTREAEKALEEAQH